MTKRLTAGVVAVATALSLSVSPAFAADEGSSNNGGTDSNSSAGENKPTTDKDGDGMSDAHDGSYESSSDAMDKNDGSSESWDKFYGSSYDNDGENDYPRGTTADILWGFGITAAILGVASFVSQSGMIPGFKLPF
ncbi:hypothetical protein [Corynebacterium sp.]|uniref:hypothetical protein n=1 Tax=Corynebacterium sp. TaxID=1720 RepID=UPI0026DB0E39|nr:hypothetical protein [Corynebacterium sp.]MDO5032568.1 hypothetical protein [Corynebacterium sp.]